MSFPTSGYITLTELDSAFDNLTPTTLIQGNTTWANNLLNGAVNQYAGAGAITSVSLTGQPAGFFAYRSSDSQNAGAQNPALFGLALNDNASLVQTSTGGYFEGRHLLGAGTTYGLQATVVNTGAVVDITPYALAPTGSSVALWLSSGRPDAGGSGSSSAAIGISANGGTYRKGIVFGSGSILPTNGMGIALALPCFNGALWYDQSGAPAAQVTSSITSATGFIAPATLQFNQTGLDVRTADGAAAISARSGLNTLINTKINGALEVVSAATLDGTLLVSGHTYFNGGLTMLVGGYPNDAVASAAGVGLLQIYLNTVAGCLTVRQV